MQKATPGGAGGSIVAGLILVVIVVGLAIGVVIWRVTTHGNESGPDTMVITDVAYGVGGGKPKMRRDVQALVREHRRPGMWISKALEESGSWFGGKPPQFDGFKWPAKDGRPLGFLGCIDLAQVTNVDWLPAKGRLLFFYDQAEQPWGFDPKDAGGWSVIHVPEGTRFDGEASPPAGHSAEWTLPRVAVDLREANTPPPWEMAEELGVQMSDAESDAYLDLMETERGEEPKHQMGGWQYPIQNAEMGLECQLVSNGIYLGDASGQDDPRIEELSKQADDWKLLLQFDSDDDLNTMWGDAGIVYFWVRKQEAAKGDFSGVWCILQCH